MCCLGEPSTQLTFAGKYATPEYAAIAMLARGLPLPTGPADAVIGYYHRKVSPGRVNLGAELTVFPKVNKTNVSHPNNAERRSRPKVAKGRDRGAFSPGARQKR